MWLRIVYIIGGLIAAGVGAAMVNGGTSTNVFDGSTHHNFLYFLGILMTATGAIFAQVGVIAVGVTLGISDEKL